MHRSFNLLKKLVLPSLLMAAGLTTVQGEPQEGPNVVFDNATILRDTRLVARESGRNVDVLVFEGNGHRCMRFDLRNLFQSCMSLDDPDELVLAYTKGMLSGLRLLPKPPERVLLLGLGGGSIARSLMQNFPGVKLDAVELDQAVIRTAEKWFNFAPNSDVQVYESDARVFTIRQLQGDTRYDLILVDAYNSEYIPEHLLTVEFFDQLKQLLRPDGVVAANIFAKGRLQQHELATWQTVFPHRALSQRNMNRILYASRNPIEVRNDTQRLIDLYGEWDKSPLAPIPHTASKALTDEWSPSNVLQQQPSRSD